jgi:serine-type D-Ala-D-Ala endopeptidase (penicillin-binding protein 7)
LLGILVDFVIKKDVRKRYALTIAVLAAACIIAGSSAEARNTRIEPLTGDGRPNVQSPRAVVMDAATGAELFSRNAGDVVGIASTTKIFVAMVVRRRGIDLDGVTTIERVDTDYARGGARTRLELRHSFANRDLLRAMLIASDNRAPTALARAVGLDPDALIKAMNSLARELGLANTRFTDPSGLRGNVSTAREMAIALREAMGDPVLAEIMGAREASVRSIHSKPHLIHYRNTNDVLHSKQYEVLGGKTGYTQDAGYCLVVAARVKGRDVIMVFLGERHKRTRFGDFGRVVNWMKQGLAPALDAVPRVTGGSSIIRAAASGRGSL